MRVLTVSDKIEPVLYGPYLRQRVGKVDLILSCGDLPYDYLEFIVSTLDAPLFYVHGNHDLPVPEVPPLERVEQEPPLAWAVNLNRRTVEHRGLLLAGLEGSPRYKPRAPFQYTESEVAWQVFWLSLRLLLNRLRYGRYLDILVTHAPAFGIHDAPDLAHRGFRGYLALLRRVQPLIMLHGHRHVYNNNVVVDTDLGPTHIINTYGFRVLDLEPRPDRRGWVLVCSKC